MKIMRNKKGLALFFCTVVCLWMVVLATYAAQNHLGVDKRATLPMQDANCSSSSSGGE